MYATIFLAYLVLRLLAVRPQTLLTITPRPIFCVTIYWNPITNLITKTKMMLKKMKSPPLLVQPKAFRNSYTFAFKIGGPHELGIGVATVKIAGYLCHARGFQVTKPLRRLCNHDGAVWLNDWVCKHLQEVLMLQDNLEDRVVNAIKLIVDLPTQELIPRKGNFPSKGSENSSGSHWKVEYSQKYFPLQRFPFSQNSIRIDLEESTEGNGKRKGRINRGRGSIKDKGQDNSSSSKERPLTSSRSSRSSQSSQFSTSSTVRNPTAKPSEALDYFKISELLHMTIDTLSNHPPEKDVVFFCRFDDEYEMENNPYRGQLFGFAPPQTRKDDFLCRFEGSEILAVVRKYKDKYQILGRAVSIKNWPLNRPERDPECDPITLHLDVPTLQILTRPSHNLTIDSRAYDAVSEIKGNDEVNFLLRPPGARLQERLFAGSGMIITNSDG